MPFPAYWDEHRSASDRTQLGAGVEKVLRLRASIFTSTFLRVTGQTGAAAARRVFG